MDMICRFDIRKIAADKTIQEELTKTLNIPAILERGPLGRLQFTGKPGFFQFFDDSEFSLFAKKIRKSSALL